MKPNHPIPIKIVVADDHPLYLDGFTELVNATPQFKIIGEAKNGEELIDKAKNLNPDIVVTDIRMPGIDGIQATKELTASIPGIKIIALTMVDEDNFITDMMAAGAKGYLLKTASADEIIAAIKAVQKGESYYCKETTSQLVKILCKPKYGSTNKTNNPNFSEREIAVMKLLCHGFSHKEIANELHLSSRTIEWHKNQILEKLDSKNTASIVAYAIKNKIC